MFAFNYSIFVVSSFWSCYYSLCEIGGLFNETHDGDGDTNHIGHLWKLGSVEMMSDIGNAEREWQAYMNFLSYAKLRGPSRY